MACHGQGQTFSEFLNLNLQLEILNINIGAPFTYINNNPKCSIFNFYLQAK
jgi:hypothetical protein